LDANANIILFNKFTEKLTGYKKEKIPGKNLFNFFIPKRNGSTIPKVSQNVLKEILGISGYESTQEIRKFNKDLIIKAQTAYAMIDDKKKTIEAGCNDYISKPIKRHALLNKIGIIFNILKP
jgi:PAS domain S-box-containing protein